MKILVVGGGSIGKRHIQNLKTLGVQQIGICEPNPARLQEVQETFGLSLAFPSLGEALSRGSFEAAFVCVPTAFHVPVALSALKGDLHLFLEKPIAHTMEGVEEMLQLASEHRRVVMVAYHLRFHPALARVRSLLKEGRLGKILSARVQCGQYLPDWHPWEDYRAFYMAKEEQGGGAVLDISHEIDYLRSLLGEVIEVSAFVDHISSLEITSDDLSALLLRFAQGTVASVHLDLISRVYRRNCELIGEKGTLLWDYAQQTIRIFDSATRQWSTETYTEDKNEIYRREASQFLQCVEKGTAPPVDGVDGQKTLAVVLAAKRSSREKRVVSPTEFLARREPLLKR